VCVYIYMCVCVCVCIDSVCVYVCVVRGGVQECEKNSEI
jgi:hypothetical protein